MGGHSQQRLALRSELYAFALDPATQQETNAKTGIVVQTFYPPVESCQKVCTVRPPRPRLGAPNAGSTTGHDGHVGFARVSRVHAGRALRKLCDGLFVASEGVQCQGKLHCVNGRKTAVTAYSTPYGPSPAEAYICECKNVLCKAVHHYSYWYSHVGRVTIHTRRRGITCKRSVLSTSLWATTRCAHGGSWAALQHSPPCPQAIHSDVWRCLPGAVRAGWTQAAGSTPSIQTKRTRSGSKALPPLSSARRCW